MSLMTTAIVFAPTAFLYPDVAKGIQHCIRRRYHMIGVVKDDWKTAMDYLADGTADVLVVADPTHLDPRRAPRIELAVDDVPPGPSEQRTRLIDRSAEE